MLQRVGADHEPWAEVDSHHQYEWPVTPVPGHGFSSPSQGRVNPVRGQALSS